MWHTSGSSSSIPDTAFDSQAPPNSTECPDHPILNNATPDQYPYTLQLGSHGGRITLISQFLEKHQHGVTAKESELLWLGIQPLPTQLSAGTTFLLFASRPPIKYIAWDDVADCGADV